ncbi:MAG: hypothetical protein EOO54_22510, partial [Haliea sp.]
MNNDSITLSAGGLRCEIKPALGGCIAGLWLGDTAVLRSTPAGDAAAQRGLDLATQAARRQGDGIVVHGFS